MLRLCSMLTLSLSFASFLCVCLAWMAVACSACRMVYHKPVDGMRFARLVIFAKTKAENCASCASASNGRTQDERCVTSRHRAACRRCPRCRLAAKMLVQPREKTRTINTHKNAACTGEKKSSLANARRLNYTIILVCLIFCSYTL